MKYLVYLLAGTVVLGLLFGVFAAGMVVGERNKKCTYASAASLSGQLDLFARRIFNNPPINVVERACVWLKRGYELGSGFGSFGQDWACMNFDAGTVDRSPEGKKSEEK